VREVIHAFNDTGFAALDPKWSGGRPCEFGPAAPELICQTARSTPSALGQPFATWSLTKLADYLAEHFRLPVSTATIRRVLRKAGITWKASWDPDFAAKMARVLALYDNPPADGRVICVDEFAPAEPPAPARSRLVPQGPAGAAPRDLHPHRRGAADVRRAGSGLGADVLPVPGPQTLAGVPRVLSPTTPPLPHATPKRRFAVNSKIRRPDYLPNAA
jgi:transposase